MTVSGIDPQALLQSRGLRSTPQRRAILAAFEGGPAEHLSTEEVYARATDGLPDLSRATVYATLAEFAELGLIGAVGTPEPVRYEVNIAPHDHFRCRLCLRLFDLDSSRRELGDLTPPGFVVDRVEVRAEGVCLDCADYGAGLAAGGEMILRESPTGDAFSRRGTAATEVSSPLGPLLLGATSDGLFRVAFAEHADADQLRSLAAGRRGGTEARDHLAQARQGLEDYFAGYSGPIGAEIDWDALPPDWVDSLRATREVPFAAKDSFRDLLGDAPARTRGEAFGANPVPIILPCHRITRGVEVPDVFVGGGERRHWLLAHEREVRRRR